MWETASTGGPDCGAGGGGTWGWSGGAGGFLGPVLGEVEAFTLWGGFSFLLALVLFLDISVGVCSLSQ